MRSGFCVRINAEQLEDDKMTIEKKKRKKNPTKNVQRSLRFTYLPTHFSNVTVVHRM